MQPGHAETPRLSRTMAKNMGIVEENKTYDKLAIELKRLNCIADWARQGRNFRDSYVLNRRNPSYSQQQIDFYMDQEMDRARQDYRRYLYDWGVAIKENEYQRPVDYARASAGTLLVGVNG
jgi:hypothetical protein